MATERYKIITCFLPQGRAAEVLERLRKEYGISSALYHHARGVGFGTRRGRRSFHASEREVITVLARESNADEVFRFLYFDAGLDAPNSGMVFMERALRANPLELPEIPEPQA